MGERSKVWYVSHAPIMMILAPVLVGMPEPLAALAVFAVAALACWGLAWLDSRGTIAFLYESPRLRKRAPVT